MEEAGSPAGPEGDALPTRLHAKRAGGAWWEGWQRHTVAAGCVALQLLGLLLIYGAHELLVTPGVEHARQRMMVQQGQQPLERHLAAECPAHCRQGSSSSNCTVGLGQADAQLLRREVEAMAHSLADRRAWPLGAPDVQQEDGHPERISKGQKYEPRGTAVPRPVDQAFGPAAFSANVPGVEDVHEELRQYNERLVEAMVLEEAHAAKRQHRAQAEELGLRPRDPLNDTASIPARVAFLNDLHAEVEARESLHVCLTTTSSVDLLGVRRELLPWMQYHVELGVTRFYILYDGHDPAAVAALEHVAAVRLLHIHSPFASAVEAAKYEFYAKQAPQWGGRPGNYELMVKQAYGETEALRRAREEGMHWLLHVDPDELMHSGGPAFSLTAVLARQPPHVPSLRFMNFEGQPEAGDLVNRLEQVTLFRVHKHFITPEAHHYRYRYKLGDSAAFLTLYANGKAAVRVDAPGVRHLGPHFFTGEASPRWQTQDNPRGEWRDAISDDTVVLHYAYSYIQDVSSKAHRSCPNEYLEAARKGDKEKVKACFVIEFDQDAYLAAAQGQAAIEDFFYSRMVLSEGSRFRCQDGSNSQEGWCTLTDVSRFKYIMEKLGLYRRMQAPQVLLQQHERQIFMRQQQGAAKGAGAFLDPVVRPTLV